MHTINNVFDKVYVVNLERDKDKHDLIKSKLNQLNIDFEFYKAVDGSKLSGRKLLRQGTIGQVGCKQSHMNIFKQAKLENLSKILILEDDLFLLKDFNNHFHNCYEALINTDSNWGQLYLGGTNRNRINWKANGNLVQKIGSQRVYSTIGIGYTNKFFDLILSGELDNRPIDDLIAENINDHNYICYPHLLYQDIDKQSNTAKNNNRDQAWFNNLNQVDASQYF
jgi:hypothetical protein